MNMGSFSLLALVSSIVFLSSFVHQCEALGSFTNPLFVGADPGLLFDPMTQSYYVVTTGGDDSKGMFAITASKDLIHWTSVGSLF